MEASIDVRLKAGLDFKLPLSPVDLCENKGITVRFVDVSMEGMYLRRRRPEIWVSSLRPLVRRMFTCAHELGHHVFGHGSSIDELLATDRSRNGKELAADAFAGFLLMPTIGIRNAFMRRNIGFTHLSDVDVYFVASNFGVGYETLVQHMFRTAGLISANLAESLLKSTPKIIRRKVLGKQSDSPLTCVDKYWSGPTIDCEVGMQLLIPDDVSVRSELLKWEQQIVGSNVFSCAMPGIVQLLAPSRGWAAFVRISKNRFVGLARYRHLEE
jgi:Zn-dependent peptidase ImmA (M78 family)